MRRSFVLLILLTSLFWQSLSLAGQASPFQEADELGHALLHWQDAAHHHDDDGSFHAEDSADAVKHVMADGALHTPGILCAALWLAAPLPPAMPMGFVDKAPPAPVVDGPRRPPRLTA